jgi:SH3 domain protein
VLVHPSHLRHGDVPRLPAFRYNQPLTQALTLQGFAVSDTESLPVKYWVLFLVLLLGAQPLLAQPTRYVSDELEVDMRAGPTLQHRIVRFLPSGTVLQELETSDGWSRVRTRAGEEGWILSRFLMNTPSARDRLERATTSMNQAQAEAQQLRQELASERERLKAAEAEIAQLSTGTERMKEQLGDAAKGLTLLEENRELQKREVDLRRVIQDREAEIARLSDRSRQDWFMAGAGVLVLGMFIGIIVPRIRWKKRSSWDRL